MIPCWARYSWICCRSRSDMALVLVSDRHPLLRGRRPGLHPVCVHMCTFCVRVGVPLVYMSIIHRNWLVDSTSTEQNYLMEAKTQIFFCVNARPQSFSFTIFIIFMHLLSTCFWFFHRICITLFAVPRYIMQKRSTHAHVHLSVLSPVGGAEPPAVELALAAMEAQTRTCVYIVPFISPQGAHVLGCVGKGVPQ